MRVHLQESWRVRCDWGPAGMAAVGAGADVVVVVDVVTFSTCVDVATARGAEIAPFAWKDERAAARARELGATLAVPREAKGLSLSPVSFENVAPGTRVLLPSP